MSFQVQLEEGSNKFWCIVRSSASLNDPKYPKQIEAQTTFLLCFFHFFASKMLFRATRISKIKGSEGIFLSSFSDLSSPRTRNLEASFELFWLLRPSIFEIVCNSER